MFLMIAANNLRGIATSAMERDGATMTNDLCADLDQLLAQTGQRPLGNRL
jgi:hypothetical protein